MPLSPGATLAWLGFSEEGLLAAYDSSGELRLRSELFCGAWVTAFSATAGEGRVMGWEVWGGGGVGHAGLVDGSKQLAGRFT